MDRRRYRLRPRRPPLLPATARPRDLHRPPPGIEGIRNLFATLHNAFPDAHVTLDDVLAEGDKVVVRSTLSGTHQGTFMGIPATGRHVSITGIDIVRMRDGKMVEHWGNED